MPGNNKRSSVLKQNVQLLTKGLFKGNPKSYSVETSCEVIKLFFFEKKVILRYNNTYFERVVIAGKLLQHLDNLYIKLQFPIVETFERPP